MASYSSYKRITADSINASNSGVVPASAVAAGAGNNYGVQWIFNERGLACRNCQQGCCEQANGKCCLWTVPSNVTSVTFEIWSGGGGGAGHTCCNCCSFSIGGAGGNYAARTVATTPGQQYTVCAGGAWPCHWSHTCDAGMGCRSYVNGTNLSNFCVTGGCGGWMCNGDAWGPRHHDSGCANCNICGFFGADLGMMGTVGFKPGHGACHCYRTTMFTGSPPIIGGSMSTSASDSWCSCGCYTNWPAGGGPSGTSSYCDNFAKQCSAGMGMGGSGVVRITYM
jgi:hypothetical protein